MQEDKSTGLILPEHILDSKRTEETWTYDTLRKLRYAGKEMNDRDVDLILTCKKCNTVLELSDDRIVCQCKTRRVLR